MRQSLLHVLLLTTITLSLSDVLPIVSIDQTDAESPGSGRDYDNTFNALHDNAQNILYGVYDGPVDKEKSSKPRRKYKFNPVRSSDDFSKRTDSYEDKGFRKEQWHNYPRQLDRLHENSLKYSQIANTLTDFGEKDTNNNELTNYLQMSNNDKDIIDNNDIEDVAGPLLILKIRLAFLTNNMNNIKKNKNKYTNAVPLDSTNSNKLYINDEDSDIYNNKINPIVNNKRERKGKIKAKDISFSEMNPDERKSVNKRIFSLWSRLQSLSHKGHELHHRRHLYTFYGLPDNGSGALTAETRASLVRPPGSPLRWG